ncbi:MAG TPA: iron export ABC transporter permease subunit FetB [Acidimicrobiales bacterium]
MSETDIGWAGVAASLVLIVVALALSGWQGLRLSRSILWASLRAGVQLFLVGFALKLVLDPDASLWWAWLWLVVMVGFAGVTIRNRAREVPGILWLGSLSMAAVLVVSMAVILGFGMFPVEGRTIVPLAGMMIGNSMTASVVAGRRIVGELSDKRDEVEARLALGHSWSDAARPYVRSALRTALTPQIESTKAVGLVFLPGALTGLVLAGVDASDAVSIQLAIMYLILGSVATSITVIGLGLTRRMFTPDHRLRRVVRPAG